MSFGKRWNDLNPYELHKTLINEYFLTSKDKTLLLKRDTTKDKRDIDVIREHHQFLWNDDEGEENLSWEKRLAKKYYEKLYREYCVGDLSKYLDNKIGLRWRTEQELLDGKGQFSCGNQRCAEREGLKTWEVNFGYVEQEVKKNALVKIRLCPHCSYKLNYHHKKKEVRRLKRSHSKTKETKQESDVEGKRSKTEERSTETDATSEVAESSKSKSEVETDDVWKQSHTEEETESISREEEFDKYLDQLFL